MRFKNFTQSLKATSLIFRSSIVVAMIIGFYGHAKYILLNYVCVVQ